MDCLALHPYNFSDRFQEQVDRAVSMDVGISKLSQLLKADNISVEAMGTRAP